jgi:RNA polymerase sigma-70 factor (ECF subfamily)
MTTSTAKFRVGTADDKAFACVSSAWQAHEAELRGFLRNRLPDTEAADDVLQDVFLKAMRAGQGFCSLDNPRAWLYQVVRNALVDRYRAERPTMPLPDDLADTAPLLQEPTVPVDALAGCLTRVLDELSDDDARILRACDLQGQTQRQFAAASGLTLAAAKSRLLRARRRLRDRLTTVCRVQFGADGCVDDHHGRRPEAAARSR